MRRFRSHGGSAAHLWTCTHPVVGEQLFILVSDQFGHDHIKVRRSGYCLEYGLTATQEPCDFSSPRQSWDLRDTGEITTLSGTSCLAPFQDDTKGSSVGVFVCTGSIAERWFF